jgi:hypothetical protein
MPKRGWTVGALCAGALVCAAGGSQARKVVTVLAGCPAGAGERLIDAHAERDVCVGSTKIACHPEESLEIDAKGERDVCRGKDAKERKPICPAGFSHKARVGEDACETETAPICRKGYELSVRPGEDVCVY